MKSNDKIRLSAILSFMNKTINKVEYHDICYALF